MSFSEQQCYFHQIAKGQESSLYQAQQQYSPNSRQPNTSYYFSQQEKSINFLSKGGNQYFLPLDFELTQTFTLPEGVLLGWGKDEFNYCALLNHPLGQLSPLGVYNQTLQIVDPWIHSQEEIIFVSQTLPIIVTYNAQLMRHCVHILKVNMDIDIENIQFQNTFMHEEACEQPCKLVSELFYEENIKEEKARYCVIIEGNEDGELLLCLLSDTTLRILSMNFCEQVNISSQNINVFNNLKLVQIIQSVSQIQKCELIEKSIKAESISIFKQRLKYHKNHQGYIAYQMIQKQQIEKNLLIQHLNNTITILNGSKIVVTYSPSEPINDINQYNITPQINDELLSTILWSLRKALDPQQFVCILKDVLTNCLNDSELDEYNRFLYLILFYLKLSNSKKDGEEQINKKLKSNNNSVYQSPIREVNTQNKQFNKLLQSQYHKQKTNYNVLPQKSDKKFLQFTYHMTLEMFNEIQEKILYVLHLLYQELTIQQSKLANNLLYLLYCYSVNLDSELSQTYQDYYLRIDSILAKRYATDINIQLLPTIKPLPQLGQTQRTNILPPNPVDLNRWLQSILNNNPISFPILFKNTKQLLELFINNIILHHKANQLNYEKNQLIHISCILNPEFQDFQQLTQQKKHYQFQLFYQQILNKDLQQEIDQQKQRKNEIIGKLDGAPLLLYLLNEKKWDKNRILSLPIQFKIPLLEMISPLREDFPNILMPYLSKESFEIINRMDLYRNRELYIQPKPTGEFKKYVNSILSGQIKSLHLQQEENPHFSFDQHSLNQVKRLFDYGRDIRIKSKMSEHIPEERLDQDAPAVLLKLLNKKLAMFIGLGALTYGTNDHFITDQIKFPNLNLSGVLEQNSLKLTIDSTREDYTQLTQWPEFHLGVSLALELSKKLKGLSQESLRTWIFYQKPNNPSNIHGGFMLGLGFLGYLNSFNQIDLYQLLTQNHELTSVGVLLGIGASRLGTCDEPTQKSLTIHIPTLIPSIYDLELPSNVSTSALCALGFLFMSSGNRNFTEVALGLIGRKPHNDKMTDREGYSLAAGIALGLINLGKGSVWRRELQIEDRLIRFVQGGKVMPPPQSSLSTNFVQNENQISNIKEGNMVNVHVTCPASLIALSLMFLMTGQQSIVDQLSIPNSFSSLEQCNPNQIILKSLASNLIMWDNIPMNQEQLYNQIPELIRYLYEQPIKKIHQKYYIVYNVEVIDFMSVSMIYTGMIAGALLAIGIKFAGSHDTQLKQLIINELNFLLKIKVSQNEFANDPDNKCAIDQYSYYTNIVNGIQALSLVMAGSFDLEVLAMIKQIRSKMEHSSIWHFGFHQALKMALGVLFMGKGGFSFKKNPKSVAMLFLSYYPYYPSTTGDNKQYLQALRWCYVLAIQTKIFKIIDVNTQKQCQALVKLEEEDGLQKFILDDPNYCRLNFQFQSQKKSIQTIYVQSKVLGKLNQDLLNQNSQLHNIDTLLKMEDYQSIYQKLKGLIEWKYIQGIKDKLPLLKLLQNNYSDCLSILRQILTQKNGQYLPILKNFYSKQPNSIFNIDGINYDSVTFDDLSLYVNNMLNPLDDQQLRIYQKLVVNNIPCYYELKQIKQVSKQIPLNILEFYLFKSYPDVAYSQLKILAKALSQI